MKKIVSLSVALVMSVFILAACGNSGKYKDGSYEGVGKGASGEIKVSVEVKKGKIEDIKLLEHKETKTMIEPAIENLVPEIKKKQSTEGIDTVSGATNSSKGILEAINGALEKAKK
ncbi:FMN-binding protein [Clostridium sp. MSJ-4]|uniref:FMN-binding protein n=1 Tax=Clostridium simiarum TaxID=2841506 RepID=A0ABS6F6A5_9CLOT|nr:MULTISPECIES: FMN-binding protein [Clostridium]MBU5593360.1 FMN-binding protein [Clostridium simiarum]